MHTFGRSWRVVLAAVFLAALSGPFALAQGAKVASLTITLPAWSAMAESEQRDALLEEIRPLAREHRFSCRSAEAFVLAGVVELPLALEALLPHLPEGPKAVPLVEEERLWLAELMGGGMMFHRLLIVGLADEGAWLVVC